MAGSREKAGGVAPHVVELSAFCHATEDCGRVRSSILNLLPPSLRDGVILTEETTTGYYGNRITVFRARILEQCEEVLRYISSIMDETSKSILRVSIHLRFDQKARRLTLRFSKQDAFMGKARLLDSDDVVKIVVHFKGVRDTGRLLEYLEELGVASSPSKSP
ncbi:MAG: exosome protein [Desulfurococcus sp.]|nr:exosome protein [Desulfurococcus sp.]